MMGLIITIFAITGNERDADSVPLTCHKWQVITSSSFPASPAKWHDGIPPSPLQTRFHGCPHAAHGARPANHPAHPPASFSSFPANRSTFGRQPAASFAKVDTYHQPGSRHIIYGLGNKSRTFLQEEFNVDLREASWDEKNRGVGRIFLEHALLVSDVMVSLELACRKRDDIKLLYEDQLALRSERQPFQWRVKARGGVKLGVIPDRVFALEHADQNARPERVHFFLEADRSTMPVVRRTLSQTSFYRKLLAYEATWTQKIHQRHLGIHRFRVLTVTTVAARVQSLLEACSQLKRGHGLFLFADRTVLEKDPFSAVWRRGKSSEAAGILDLPKLASHPVS